MEINSIYLDFQEKKRYRDRVNVYILNIHPVTINQRLFLKDSAKTN
jgi:hypothetical protein